MPGAVHQVNVFVVPAATANEEISTIFLEFGLLILGLGIIARLARRWEISAVPFYLLAGLLFGEGGLSVVDSSDALVPTLAELGVILLLLLLGLEYSGDELVQTAQRQSRSGVIDLIANSVPGALVGFAFGWGVPGALALAGVTYISSSGIVARESDDACGAGRNEGTLLDERTERCEASGNGCSSNITIVGCCRERGKVYI